MSDTFNEYHVWLGIPPHEQPPNHYRLLGIALFESDLDVIDHAADRQMAHVRTFQSGRHGARSQQLLNELAVARLSLLDPDKKSAYDEQLRARLAGAPRAMPVAAPLPKAEPVLKADAALKGQPALRGESALKGQPALRAEPAVRPIPSARPVGTAHGNAHTATPAGQLAHDLEIDEFDLPAAPAELKIRTHRRSYGDSSWKSALALGLLSGVIVVSFLFFYYFYPAIIKAVDWRRIWEGPPASLPASDESLPAVDDTAAPPPPDPGQR